MSSTKQFLFSLVSKGILRVKETFTADGKLWQFYERGAISPCYELPVISIVEIYEDSEDTESHYETQEGEPKF